MLSHCEENPLRRPIPAILHRTLLALLLGLGPGSGWAEGDTRLSYSAGSPPWLQAVGQLQVPGIKFRDGYPRHHQENCSATLVSNTPSRDADTIITAWHCLEFYRDLSQRIMFTLLPATEQPIVTQALPLAYGGAMSADWAVLRLRKPIPAARVRALQLHPEQADPARPIIMAGYSRDKGIGARGSALSYDPQCRITGVTGSAASRDSNCRAHKGASGGAVVQLSITNEPLFSGVVSEGDGVGLSRFVPLSVFRSKLPVGATGAARGD